eukprot:5055603-Alexandrium_andersonii.AAC.1
MQARGQSDGAHAGGQGARTGHQPMYKLPLPQCPPFKCPSEPMLGRAHARQSASHNDPQRCREESGNT